MMDPDAILALLPESHRGAAPVACAEVPLWGGSPVSIS